MNAGAIKAYKQPCRLHPTRLSDLTQLQQTAQQQAGREGRSPQAVNRTQPCGLGRTMAARAVSVSATARALAMQDFFSDSLRVSMAWQGRSRLQCWPAMLNHVQGSVEGLAAARLCLWRSLQRSNVVWNHGTAQHSTIAQAPGHWAGCKRAVCLPGGGDCFCMQLHARAALLAAGVHSGSRGPYIAVVLVGQAVARSESEALGLALAPHLLPDRA